MLSGYNTYHLLYHLEASFDPKFLKQLVFVTQTHCVFCEVGNAPFAYYVIHLNLRRTGIKCSLSIELCKNWIFNPS